jgi:CheY-like chemotaxis protein
MDIESKLLDLGYQVISVCTTGEEEVRKTTELHPDLILMDIVLKGKMDGIEAAQKIRMLDNNAIIFVTANNDDETLQRAKITEPYAYIQKPVSSRELHVAVEVALYKHAAQKEISTQLQQLTAMCMVDKAILNNHDPRQALRVALHQITFQLELDAAAVLLCDPISFTFNFFEGYGFRSPTYRNLCMSLGNDFSTIFSHPEQFEINQDILSSGNESRLDYDNEENFISYIVMPLYSKDKLKGILEVFRRSPIDAKPEWVEFLKALANQAAVAIDNASMLDELNTANLMIM